MVLVSGKTLFRYLIKLANFNRCIGQTIAYRWYASGCRTLDDVRAGKGGVKLTPAMEIGLRFYDGVYPLAYLISFADAP